MSPTGTSAVRLDRPVDHTLKWVVVVPFRLLAWVWSIALIITVVARDDPGDRRVLAVAAVASTLWTGFTVWASWSEDRVGTVWFSIADGAFVFTLSAVGYLAGAADFVSGGYPASWLFVVAYATNLRWTMAAAVALLAEHVLLHDLMDLGMHRTVGSFQFLVFGLIAGWGLQAIREQEQRRMTAEQELAEERAAAVRLEQGAELGRLLHDSVLQTLQAIRSDADDAAQVRYLARRQERELRRTIEQLRSPHERSFRVELLAIRDEIEDLYRSHRIVEVIREDAPLTETIETGLAAAREALTNAAKHSGVNRIDLYAEVADGWAVVRVRDRGAGFDARSTGTGHGSSMSMRAPVERVGGDVEIDTAPGRGTEVTIRVPTG